MRILQDEGISFKQTSEPQAKYKLQPNQTKSASPKQFYFIHREGVVREGSMNNECRLRSALLPPKGPCFLHLIPHFPPLLLLQPPPPTSRTSKLINPASSTAQIKLKCLSQNGPQFCRSFMSDSLQPQGLQHARLPCPSSTPGVYSNSCPSSQ